MSRLLLDDTNTPASERSYQIPWIYDAHAYNMCNEMPERTINVTEGDWKKEIGDLEEVESLYIMTDLEEKDYEIIAGMVNLKALYLYTARELKDISFKGIGQGEGVNDSQQLCGRPCADCGFA